MKAAIYNPYLDTLGGGERYTLSFASVLARRGYQVDFEWKEKLIKEKLGKRFGMALDGINFIKNIRRGDGYDICFWLSDGSIPLLRARKNILHFQVPFKGINGRTLFNKMKLFRIEKVICNSYFTKSFIDNEYGIKSIVIYPPLDVDIKPKKKENVILSVARFSQLEQAKRQDILVSTFKKMVRAGLKNWELVLAGGIEVGAKEFIKKLERMSRNFPIKIIKSPDYTTLKDLYGKAKIFWSASGFGIDVNKEPQKVEHFGISVVEAMAAGVVPVVFNAGGHKEIVDNGNTGYLWDRETELKKISQMLIENNKLIRKVKRDAVEASKVYEYERFAGEAEEIIH